VAQADWHRLCLCLWNKHNLSQWDKHIGTGCACPAGTSRLAVPNLFHWVYERSKETSPCAMTQVIYPQWRPFLVPWHKLYTTMELVPVSLVPTCAKKWVYKALKLFSLFMIDKVHQTWFCLFNGDGILIRQPGTSSTEAIDQL